MSYVVSFLRFWYDFVVGDDWTIAVAVVVALVVTALLAHSNLAAWWVMPLAVVAVLGASLWRVASRDH